MAQPTVQHLDRWLYLQILTYIMWSDVEPFWKMSTNVSSCTSCSKPQSISILEMLSIVTRRYVIFILHHCLDTQIEDYVTGDISHYTFLA